MDPKNISDGFRQTIRNLYRNMMPIDQISAVFKLTPEEVEVILELREADDVKED